MNRVVLTGNIASDLDYTTTASGVAKCSFRLAVSRRYKNAQGQREADFLTVACWRQTAEFARNYLEKGRRIAVEGSIQTRSYDAQDGTKRYVTEIIADQIEPQGGAAPEPQPARSAQGAHSHQMSMRDTEFTPVDNDDLPF